MLRTLKGEGVGKRGQRWDLIHEFGYDTKAAMHLIRVIGEGIELMRHGTITLPRPERDLLISIRLGKFSTLQDIEAMANRGFAELDAVRRVSKLPENTDREAVSKLVAAAYMEHWNNAGMMKAFPAPDRIDAGEIAPTRQPVEP